MKIRINKYLASVGVASRRKIDELVSQQRVIVNGALATPGQQIDPQTDKISIDGKLVKNVQPKLVYYLLNKPASYISTCSDDQGRDTVLDLVPNNERLFPIGRLDCQTSGLIILTNDGELALKLTHPRYHLPKTYRITISGTVPREEIMKLSRPIILDDGPTLPSTVEKITYRDYKTIVDLTIFQGKNRQVRRMCQALGFKIDMLNRISIGPINLGDLKVGRYRLLTAEEIAHLNHFSTDTSR